MPAPIVDRRHLVVIAIGYASGLAAFPWLPGPYLGSAHSLVSRAAIAFLVPTAALVTHSGLETLFSCRSADEQHVESGKAVRAVAWATTLFMVSLHGLILLSLLGSPISRFSPHRLVVVLFGLLLVGIGNVLPRVRPNLAVGIRTRRLLSNRTAWARVHRVAGYFLVALGAMAIVAGLALSKGQIPFLLSAASLVGVTLNVAAYWRWTRG